MEINNQYPQDRIVYGQYMTIRKDVDMNDKNTDRKVIKIDVENQSCEEILKTVSSWR